MEIKNVNNSNNFASRRLFNTTLFKKGADGVKKPIKAFIAELTPDDFSRADLKSEVWKKTKFGEDILQDLCDTYYGEAQPLLRPSLAGEDIRFFAVEVPDAQTGVKTIALGEAKVRDEFIVLDRLQALNGHEEAEHLSGGGTNILYAISALVKKMKRALVTLESCSDAVDFYKKSEMTYEPRGKNSFFRLYQDKYDEFMKKLGNKFGITPFNQ
ncbi:MAG: hypothetical protein K6A44_07060 [bacterium]|nr:hypothetical protein [bacterium]